MSETERTTLAKERPDAATGTPFVVDEPFLRDVEALMERGEPAMVLNVVAELYPADLAELITHLPDEHGTRLLAWLSPEDGSKVLAELDESERVRLLEELHPERITQLLNELDTDDAADIISELPGLLAEQVLPRLEDARDVGELLGYPEESAGGIMSAEFVAVPLTWNVAEATEEVRRKAELVEPIFSVYVLDEEHILRGVVSLKALLLSPAKTPISQIMDADVISVKPHLDQEEVARVMQRYDLVSLAVVSDEGRMLGRITIDDVVDVIREEAEEDVQRMSGIAQGSEEVGDSLPRVVRGRLPWLVIGLVGTIMAALVVRNFEASLEAVAVLAAFIPVMTAMAGNAAIQSAAITVQGMASGKLWGKDMIRRVGKECLVAIMNGLALAVILAGVVILFGFGGEDAMRLSVVASLALFVVIVLATTNGALFPVLLDKLGIDPALAMGPFVTTSNDIVGLTVYFLIATSLFL